MINNESPVAKKIDGTTAATGGGGRTTKTKVKKNDGTMANIREGGEMYTKEQRSKFGEAFLPFASLLESVEKERVERKRRGKNVRNQPNKITQLPNYGKEKGNRINAFSEKRDMNVKKLGEKLRRMKISNNTITEKMKWKGDTMTFENGWPNMDQRNTMRVFHINLNGVTYHNDFLEWEMTVAFLMDMQVDVFGLTEINLDLDNGIVKDKFTQAAKHFDPYLRLTSSSSKQKVGESPFKMGGTVTGTNGCWSGRIINQGSDDLGRWSFMSMQAKQGHHVLFITVYIPGKPSTVGGGTTIYKQMEADVLEKKGQLLDPRKELLKDLYTFIDKERKKGNMILLMGDMNDNMGLKKGEVRSFMESVGMKVTFEERHGDKEELPPTHDRGSKCLDIIGCSNNLPEGAIVRAGYAPFYFNFFTDHRGVYIDLDIKIIFNSTRPDTTRQIYKRFTTRHVPKCARYLKKLEELMEKSRMFQKVDKLEEEYKKFNNDKKEDKKEELIEKTQGLFKQVTEFMKCAEKSAGPLPYSDGFPDSPVLRKAAFTVIRLKKYLRLVSLGTLIVDDKERENAISDLKNAQIGLRETQKSANLLRQQHMECLADKRCHQWQMSSAEALHIINESEKSKLLHGKHRRLLKSTNEGTLRSLMIPAPVTGIENDIKDPRLYTNITDSKLMFNFLLRRNFNHLMQSKDAMFTKGPLLDRCGWYGEEEGMEIILNGLLDAETTGEDYPQYGKEGVEFLKALRYAKEEDGSNIDPFTWKFGADEFIEVFNKTRESTACGPSGLHMSHWKAACERREIARVHAFFMWAAFEYGFTYERWEQSWHCMIKKLKQPIISKLRIVQLFEGDFNAGLKYLIGKKLMNYMNKKELHDPETFGSRSGKTAPEALVNLQLLFDHNRTWKLPIAILFNDAIGCYDRIIPTLCELAMRARGCPKGIAQCHTITQKKMVHRIRIATGISEGVIKFALTNMEEVVDKTIVCLQGRTGGIGQGGGAGPLSWIAVIDVMLEAYRKIRPGAEAIDPIRLYSICYWLISYVDDNTIVVSFESEVSQRKILETMRGNLGSWRRLLQLTGGDIDVSKSKWSVMRWKYEKEWGDESLELIRTFPGEIGMDSSEKNVQNTEVLGRLEPHQAERVLGVRLPLDGNMRVEFLYRCKQIREFGKKVYRAPISKWDAWMIYESRYRAMVRYPLPVTIFNDKQCMTIQRPFIDAILPKLGINRKTPRVLIYGPKSMGGLEMMDLRVEQVATHFDTSRGHMRRLDRAGKGLFITAHDIQVTLGRMTPFFELDPNENDYITENTRWRYLWKQINKLDLRLEIYNFWTPRMKTVNDRNIMETAFEDEIIRTSKWKLLKHINQCRLYVRAFTLKDLTEDGIHLYTPYLDGSERGKMKDISIPNIKRPTDNQWRIWKSFIFRNFLSPGIRINPPLGENLPMENTNLNLPISETDQLLRLHVDGLSMLEIIDLLPQNLRVLMGKVRIPEDDGLAISEAIVEGRCLGASDGSLIKGFKKQRGSHGYALRTLTGNREDIEGYGPSPGSDKMSSMTTEHFGLIGVLVVLHIISLKYLLHRDECFDQVRILVDNKTVVERSSTEQEVINLSDYGVPDQDLWTLTTDLIKKLPIRVEVQWIKGHQDSNKCGEKIHGPFSQDVAMNILVDELATRGLREGKGRVIVRPTLKNTVLSIYDREGIMVTDVRSYMTEKINGQKMQEYLEGKKGWSPDIQSTIEWAGIEGMMKKAHPLKRINLVKMLHNWQNTGQQKGKIRDANLRLMTDNPIEPTLDERNCSKCPAGCDEEEGELHYLHCPDERAIDKREKLIGLVLKKLRKLKTYEGITSMVREILTRISQRGEHEFDMSEINGQGDLSLQRTLWGQEEIGWNYFCQGYFHRGWAIIQSRYYRKNGLTTKTRNIDRWKQMFSTILSDFCMECWQMRNEVLHGKDNDESKKLKIKNIKGKVRQLYKCKEILRGTKNYKIFEMPLYKRLRYGIQSITLWVGMAEEVLKLHRENATKMTIVHWLQP